MAKTEPKPNTTINQVDLTKPVFLVFHQTKTRNVVEVFQGADTDGSRNLAKARASQKAVSGKCRVAVFQSVALYDPPGKLEAVEVQLDWTGPDEHAPLE